MNRILTIDDLVKLNKSSENLEQSFDILKTLISDESSQAFLLEDNPYGKDEDFILITKELVENINKTKIIIWPNDHNPPHFHIKFAEYEASYKIEDCEFIIGRLPKKYENKVKLWFKYGGKEKLIEYWNKLK